MNDEIWDLYTQDRIKTNQKMMRSEKIPSHLYHLYHSSKLVYKLHIQYHYTLKLNDVHND